VLSPASSRPRTTAGGGSPRIRCGRDRRRPRRGRRRGPGRARGAQRHRTPRTAKPRGTGRPAGRTRASLRTLTAQIRRNLPQRTATMDELSHDWTACAAPWHRGTQRAHHRRPDQHPAVPARADGRGRRGQGASRPGWTSPVARAVRFARAWQRVSRPGQGGRLRELLRLLREHSAADPEASYDDCPPSRQRVARGALRATRHPRRRAPPVTVTTPEPCSTTRCCG